MKIDFYMRIERRLNLFLYQFEPNKIKLSQFSTVPQLNSLKKYLLKLYSIPSYDFHTCPLLMSD